MKWLAGAALDSALIRPVADVLEEAGVPAIALDLNELASLPEVFRLRVQQWCRRLLCPVIGVGDDAGEMASAVDVVAASEAELEALQRRIAENPQAATVLVQVLRTVEHLPPLEGLLVESLAYATLQSGDEYQRWLQQYQARNMPELVTESEPPLLLERQGDQLAVILNRPGNDNSYTVEMRDALIEALTLAEMDSAIRRVRVSANGRCFCTGGELTEFGKVSSPVAGHLIRSQASPARMLLSAPERYHFHVHKACIGSGIELPACAGYLTAAPRTTFWLPELSMGLIPGAGGCVSISRRIGRQRTAYLVLLNKKIDAQKALEWGLIDAIVSEPD